MGSSTAVISAFEYLIGLAVFGIVYMFLDSIVSVFSTGLGDNSSLHQLAMYLWAGSLIIYLLFGSFYFLNSLKEWEFNR